MPREERIYACAKSFQLFAQFYFTRFTNRPAPFHEDFFHDFEDLVYGRVKDAALLAYRESAKASITKALSTNAAATSCLLARPWPLTDNSPSKPVLSAGTSSTRESGS